MSEDTTTQTGESTMTPIAKIISGGQTGADRAGLDFAIRMGIPHGGHCPKGRKALDGKIDAKYLLEETTSAGYADRTKLNVENADVTVVYTGDPELEGGSHKTLIHATKMKKPSLHIYMGMDPAEASALIGLFIVANSAKIVNIAGQRSTKAAGIEEFVDRTLTAAHVCLCSTTPAAEAVVEVPVETAPAEQAAAAVEAAAPVEQVAEAAAAPVEEAPPAVTPTYGEWITGRWPTDADSCPQGCVYVFRDGAYAPVFTRQFVADGKFEAWAKQLPF